MGLKIKKEFETHQIGFNKSALPLGARKDLHVLYELAKKTNNVRWLSMFEEVPDDKALDKIKEEKFNEKQNNKRD